MTRIRNETEQIVIQILLLPVKIVIGLIILCAEYLLQEDDDEAAPLAERQDKDNGDGPFYPASESWPGGETRRRAKQ